MSNKMYAVRMQVGEAQVPMESGGGKSTSEIKKNTSLEEDKNAPLLSVQDLVKIVWERSRNTYRDDYSLYNYKNMSPLDILLYTVVGNKACLDPKFLRFFEGYSDNCALQEQELDKTLVKYHRALLARFYWECLRPTQTHGLQPESPADLKATIDQKIAARREIVDEVCKRSVQVREERKKYESEVLELIEKELSEEENAKLTNDILKQWTLPFLALLETTMNRTHQYFASEYSRALDKQIGRRSEGVGNVASPEDKSQLPFFRLSNERLFDWLKLKHAFGSSYNQAMLTAMNQGRSSKGEDNIYDAEDDESQEQQQPLAPGIERLATGGMLPHLQSLFYNEPSWKYHLENLYNIFDERQQHNSYGDEMKDYEVFTFSTAAGASPLSKSQEQQLEVCKVLLKQAIQLMNERLEGDGGDEKDEKDGEDGDDSDEDEEDDSDDDSLVLSMDSFETIHL